MLTFVCRGPCRRVGKSTPDYCRSSPMYITRSCLRYFTSASRFAVSSAFSSSAYRVEDMGRSSAMRKEGREIARRGREERGGEGERGRERKSHTQTLSLLKIFPEFRVEDRGHGATRLFAPPKSTPVRGSRRCHLAGACGGGTLPTLPSPSPASPLPHTFLPARQSCYRQGKRSRGKGLGKEI